MNQTIGTKPELFPFYTVPTAGKTKLRATGLDALKILGTVLVIMLHAAIPYIKIPMPGLAWPVHNPTACSIVTVGFWSIECFIMPLFFVLAGYAAAAMLLKYGAEKYFWLREKRIIYPLVVGILVILPFETYLCTISWIADGRYPFAKIYSLKFSGVDQQNFWGLSHLWFLLYLGIYAGLHAFFAANQQQLLQLKFNWITLISCFVGMSFCLWLTPRITLGFRHDFLPFATNLCYYGIWFTIGLAIFNSKLLTRLTPEFGGICCMTSLIIFGLLYPVIKGHLESGEQHAQMTLLAALLIPVYAFFLIMGLLAISNRWSSLDNAWFNYLTGATLTIYLIHHPLCLICQVGLNQAELPPMLKFSIVTLFTMATSLAIYETCIRKTWIGQILHGRKISVNNRVLLLDQTTLNHKQAA